jgi:hypothetical protein
LIFDLQAKEKTMQPVCFAWHLVVKGVLALGFCEVQKR